MKLLGDYDADKLKPDPLVQEFVETAELLEQKSDAKLEHVYREGSRVFYAFDDGLGGGFECGSERGAAHAVHLILRVVRNGAVDRLK